MATSLICCQHYPTFGMGWASRLRTHVRRGAFVASAVLGAACGSPSTTANNTVTSSSSQAAAATGGPADAAAVTPTQPAGAPVREPSPPGTVAIPGMAALAELCEGPPSCPLLKLAAAQAHCRKKASPSEAWRLPTKDEAQAFATISQPAQAKVFHWTSTPFVQDPKQVWIVMPAQLQYTTTYSGEHKSFVARCVRDVADKLTP